MIVVDASALLEVLLGTPAGARIEKRLFSPGETLCAPHLIDLEVAQVLRRYAAFRDIDARRAREALEDLSDFPLTRFILTGYFCRASGHCGTISLPTMPPMSRWLNRCRRRW